VPKILWMRNVVPTNDSVDNAVKTLKARTKGISSAPRLCETCRLPSNSMDTWSRAECYRIIGLSDGLTVPFALTAGLSSLGSSKLVVTGGLAELCAGAISMGLGGYREFFVNQDFVRSSFFSRISSRAGSFPLSSPANPKSGPAVMRR